MAYKKRSRGLTSWRGDVPIGACGVGMASSKFRERQGVGGRSVPVPCYVNACNNLQCSVLLLSGLGSGRQCLSGHAQAQAVYPLELVEGPGLKSGEIQGLELRNSLPQGGQTAPERQLTLNPQGQGLQRLENAEPTGAAIVQLELGPAQLFSQPCGRLSHRTLLRPY